jgi:hypothetical protein
MAPWACRAGRQVDRRRDRRCALRGLLDAAARQHVRAGPAVYRRGGGQQPSHPAELGGGNARDGLDPFRPPACDRARDVVEPGGALREVRAVGESFGEHHVEEPEQDGEVRAGHGREVHATGGLFRRRVRQPGGRGPPRVDDDEPARRPRPGEMLHGRRHGLGQVRAEEQHRLRTPDVGQREGQTAVDAEGPVHPGCRRGHAEPAVVVDVRGTQHRARELAERVGLLVGEPAPAEHGHRPGAVLRGQGREPGRDEVERHVPAHRLQLTGRAPDQRGDEPVGRPEHRRRRPALLAQTAPVGGEVAGLHLGCGRHVRTGPRQRHPALQRAVGAVRVDGGSGGSEHVQTRASAMAPRP